MMVIITPSVPKIAQKEKEKRRGGEEVNERRGGRKNMAQISWYYLIPNLYFAFQSFSKY